MSPLSHVTMCTVFERDYRYALLTIFCAAMVIHTYSCVVTNDRLYYYHNRVYLILLYYATYYIMMLSLRGCLSRIHREFEPN